MKRYLFANSAILAMVFGLVAGPTSRAKPADLPSQNQIECPDGSDDPVQPRKFSIEVDLDLLSKRLTVKVGVLEPAAPTNIDAVCPAVVSAYIEQLIKQLNKTVADANQRLEAAATKRAEKARTLEVRLFDPVKVRIEQVPFKQAIKNLAHASGLPIVIDYKAMREARINLDAPVSLTVENTSVHKALCQLLNGLDLTCEIKNGMVQITTPMAGSGGGQERAVAAVKDTKSQRLFEAAERFRRDGEFDRARACYQQVHLLTPTTLFGRVAITRLIEMEDRMRDAAEEQGIPGRNDDPEEAFHRLRDRTIPLGLVQVSY